jgi:diguanylate cyclase (GGDEF)-like protein
MDTLEKISVENSLQDYFLHAKIRNDPDLSYRARILSHSIVTILLATVTIFFAAILIPSLENMRSVALPANIICIFFMAYALYRLKYHGAYGLCCLIVVAVGFFGVTITGILTGGPAHAPAFQLLVIPCITAYFFGGIRWGITTSVISLITILTLQIADLAGVAFPHLIAEQQLQAFVLLTNLPTVAILALIYEITSISLKDARDLQHRKYAAMAITDPLTGLPNRRIFSETLADRIALCSAMTPPRRFTLCYLDLDRFKPVNDRLGHSVGDEVLKEISNKLRLALRGADFIGRIGGDEFMILLGETHEPAAIAALAARYLKLVREPIPTSAGTVELDCSIGFAVYPDHGADTLSLEKAADAAMYDAKKSRSGYRIFTTDLAIQ